MRKKLARLVMVRPGSSCPVASGPVGSRLFPRDALDAEPPPIPIVARAEKAQSDELSGLFQMFFKNIIRNCFVKNVDDRICRPMLNCRKAFPYPFPTPANSICRNKKPRAGHVSGLDFQRNWFHAHNSSFKVFCVRTFSPARNLDSEIFRGFGETIFDGRRWDKNQPLFVHVEPFFPAPGFMVLSRFFLASLRLQRRTLPIWRFAFQLTNGCSHFRFPFHFPVRFSE